MQNIPTEWLREKTTVEEIGRDWSGRRKKHDWWTPWPPDWTREWESFLQTLQKGDELVHFSSKPELRRKVHMRKAMLFSGLEPRFARFIGLGSSRTIRLNHEVAGYMYRGRKCSVIKWPGKTKDTTTFRVDKICETVSRVVPQSRDNPGLDDETPLGFQTAMVIVMA